MLRKTSSWILNLAIIAWTVGFTFSLLYFQFMGRWPW